MPRRSPHAAVRWSMEVEHAQQTNCILLDTAGSTIRIQVADIGGRGLAIARGQQGEQRHKSGRRILAASLIDQWHTHDGCTVRTQGQKGWHAHLQVSRKGASGTHPITAATAENGSDAAGSLQGPTIVSDFFLCNLGTKASYQASLPVHRRLYMFEFSPT